MCGHDGIRHGIRQIVVHFRKRYFGRQGRSIRRLALALASDSRPQARTFVVACGIGPWKAPDRDTSLPACVLAPDGPRHRVFFSPSHHVIAGTHVWLCEPSLGEPFSAPLKRPLPFRLRGGMGLHMRIAVLLANLGT